MRKKTCTANGFNVASVNRNIAKGYGSVKANTSSNNGTATIKEEIKRLANKKI